MRGIVSIKTDVFSFGVILLEIVSGEKNNSLYEDRLNLIGYVSFLSFLCTIKLLLYMVDIEYATSLVSGMAAVER